MATKNEYFNPIIEAMKAAAQNAGNFAMHPTDQSQRAAQVAQEMFLNQSNAMRPSSPLDPSMRPGVYQDSPDSLSAEQLELLKRQQMGGLLGN
jgi:hypothetical protein